MSSKVITVETNTLKKNKLDKRSFNCQILELGKERVYVLNETKRELKMNRFNITPGCRIIGSVKSFL